jgi:hypothetical protein
MSFRSIKSCTSVLAQFIILGCVVAGSPTAWAWGADAHRLIAEQAQRLLKPKAAAEVSRLLAAEPGASMGSVASWADETRTLTTARWHYVNLPPRTGCQYQEERDCFDGNCVVAAIERQKVILGSSAPDAEQLRALKFLIHLVADVHQPLHAGHAEDRGGNLFQLQAFGRGTNLHALWDSGIVQDWPGGLTALEQAVDAHTGSASTGNTVRWANESCRLVEEAWFYPASRTLDEAYVAKARPVVLDRLRLAAVRLAELLNQRLGGG